MSTINRKETVNPVYVEAKQAIDEMRQLIKTSATPDDLTLYIHAFEDILNGLSGEILKLEKAQLEEIRSLCKQVVDEAAKESVQVNLFNKLLPTVEVKSVEYVDSVLAKKLYPLTMVVKIEDGYVIDDASKSLLDSNGSPTGANTAARISRLLGSGLANTKDGGAGSGSGFALDAGTSTPLSSTLSSQQQNQKTKSAQSDLDKQNQDSTVTGLGNSKADDYDRTAISAAQYSAAALEVPLTTGSNIGSSLNGLLASGELTSGFLQVSGGVSGVVNVAAEIVDEIDVDFDAIDKEAGKLAYEYELEEPLVQLPEELLPIVTDSLLSLITQTASNSAGLQAGLSTMFTNPLAAIIEDTKNYVIALNANNYAGLNSALGLSSGEQYAIFRDVMGGGDGYGGIYAQLEKFKDHTDRLSGLVVDEDSENAEPSRDNTVENFEYFGLPLNTPTVVLSFDARKFRSAKYYVQATAQTEHQMSELFVLHDTKDVYFRQVDTNYTRDPFILFTSSFQNNTVNVIASTTVSNTDLVINSIKFQIVSKAESYEKISLYKILQIHETLHAFYREGIDYLGNMAGSLSKLNDMLALNVQLKSSIASLKSSGSGSNLITQSSKLTTAANSLQTSIDTDYAYYKDYKKKHETIELSYIMARNYNDDSNVKKFLDLILNNSTREAIAHTAELDEFDQEDIIDEYLEENDEE